MISGIRGSGPYTAPEEYTDGEFAGHAVDIWACGIIYMAMITGCPLWRTAKKSEDALYARYLKERRQQEGFGPIESSPRVTSLAHQYYGRILGAEIYILSSYTVEISYIASWTPIHPASLRHRMY
jgi:serine/threonine protein kinase